jgi:hypothetical protein
MGEFASKGVAGTALGLGIAGTVGLVNQLGNGGLLGGLFGGGGQTQALMAENAQLKAEKYTDSKIAEVYMAGRNEKDAAVDRLLDKYIEPISKEIADMRVREAQTGAAVDCLAKSTSMRFDSVYREIDCAKKECGAAIALEGERRINGDNAIMCYVQGTYVPGKLVMPRDAICPEVMQRYNSWVAPTTPAPDTQAVTGSIQTGEN